MQYTRAPCCYQVCATYDDIIAFMIWNNGEKHECVALLRASTRCQQGRQGALSCMAGNTTLRTTDLSPFAALPRVDRCKWDLLQCASNREGCGWLA